MALDPLVAKANVGAGTDQLAGRNTAGGFVGAVMLTDEAGAEITDANALPVAVGSLPLPAGASSRMPFSTISSFPARRCQKAKSLSCVRLTSASWNAR